MSILSKIEAWLANTGNDIEAVLSPFEKMLLNKFHPLFQQIEANGEQQLVDLAETTLTSTLPTILASGGNVGVAIAASAPTIIKTLENDARTDLKNAAYGMLAATAASLPVVPAPTAPVAQ